MLINRISIMGLKVMILVACIVLVLFGSDGGVEAVIGMNWGRQSAQRLVPAQVVDLLLQNGIRHARIYTSEDDILEAFAGSGINLTVSIYNATLLSTMEDARSWVSKKSPYFYRSNIRTIYLGGYVFFDGLGNKPHRDSAIKSLQHLQDALDEAGHGDQIKATFLHFDAVLKKNRTRASEAEFRDEIKEDMITTLRFLQKKDAPFVIEMLPIFEIQNYNFDLSFAFPDNRSRQVVRDINGAVYTNVFEFTYDSFVWALNKLNASNIKIIVGQVGWPTDGLPSANAAAAERFFKGLLPLVASNKGTPMRPGAPIDTYIQALTDETRMPRSASFARHWGIYRSNGKPKYKIDLSGQGRDIFPTMMKGLMFMPKRWCVFNGDRTDPLKVERLFSEACLKGDCSTMAHGGSCSQLSYDQNVSYAFNMYFQFQFQDEKACDFEGLAYVSVNDPSTDTCVFSVEVVRGRQHNYRVAKGFHHTPNFSIFFVFLLSVLGTMLIWD